MTTTAQLEGGQRLNVILSRALPNMPGAWEKAVTVAPYDSTNRPGIVELHSPTAGTVEIVAAASTVAGGILPFVTTLTTNSDANGYTYFIIIPTTMAGADRVQIHIGASTFTLVMPSAHAYDIGGVKYVGATIDQIIPDAVNQVGEGDLPVAPPPAGIPADPNHPNAHHDPRMLAPKQRALVVYEADATAQGGGRMFAVDPANVSGIPIPAFRTGPTLPPTGTIIGQGFLNTTNNLSYVWDGLAWQAIVPPSIVSYPNDNAILADTTTAAGTYAFSANTGNFFVRYTDSSNITKWRQIGIRTYDTEALLTADTTAADGSVAYATDTKRVWNRIDGSWRTSSIWLETEAHILASTAHVGAVAVAVDTGKLWIGDGVDWIGSPFREFTAESDLLASTPGDGQMAVAVDTGHVFYRSAGTWVGINLSDYNMPILAAAPAAPVPGQMYFDTATSKMQIYTGTAWKPARPDVTTGFGYNATGNDFTANFTSAGIGYIADQKQMWFKNTSDGSWHSIDMDTPVQTAWHTIASSNSVKAAFPTFKRLHTRKITLTGGMQPIEDCDVGFNLHMDSYPNRYNWANNGVVQSSQVTNFASGGIHNAAPHTELGWDVTGGARLNNNTGDYWLQAGKFVNYEIIITALTADKCGMMWRMDYIAHNGTPINTNGRAIINVGIERFKGAEIGAFNQSRLMASASMSMELMGS